MSSSYHTALNRASFNKLNLGRPVYEDDWVCVNVYTPKGGKLIGRIRLNAKTGVAKLLSAVEYLEGEGY
jgi:hypothetical protein